jgi:hypothetical protein
VFTRLEDSLIHVILKRIIEKELSITKPDKKLSLFSLQITTRNEQLSQLLCQRLLAVTSSFYIDTKTKRVRGNVERLQQRVDSIKAVLNNKTYTGQNLYISVHVCSICFTFPDTSVPAYKK